MFEKSIPVSNSFNSAQERWKRVQKRREVVQKGTGYYNWRETQYKFW